MKKEITKKYGLELIKSGFLIMAFILPIAFIRNDSALAWSFVFPLTIGFMLYSTSQ